VTHKAIADFIIESEIKIRELKITVEMRTFLDNIPRTNPAEIIKAVKKECDAIINEYDVIMDKGSKLLNHKEIPAAFFESISTIIGICGNNIKIVRDSFTTIQNTLSSVSFPLYELKNQSRNNDSSGMQE